MTLIGIILTVGSGYIAADTGLTITDYFQSTPPERLHSIWLFVLTIIWPAAAAAFYFVVQLGVVVRVLKEKKPLGESWEFDWSNPPLTSFAGSPLRRRRRRLHPRPRCLLWTRIQDVHWNERTRRFFFPRDLPRDHLGRAHLRRMEEHHRGYLGWRRLHGVRYETRSSPLRHSAAGRSHTNLATLCYTHRSRRHLTHALVPHLDLLKHL